MRRAQEILKEEGKMTLRHLFYMLVSSPDPDNPKAGLVENTEAEYKKVTSIMKNARWDGQIRFDDLFDGLREARRVPTWNGLSSFMTDVEGSYNRDHWREQDFHIEVWSEKDAIISVFEEITTEYQVTVRSLRGYNSLSAQYQTARELLPISKPIVILYLGDHDPSGENIEAVAQDTLQRMFGYLGRSMKEVEWERLAVLSTDIDDFNLLPIPVKKGDPRSRDFEAIHGESGAEVDALPMAEIRKRVEDAIVRHVNPDIWQASVEVQQHERGAIRDIAQQM